MKRLLNILLCGLLLLSMAGCSAEITETAPAETELSLWVYPVGGFAEEAAVDSLLEAIAKADPDVTVRVTVLQEDTADADVRNAMEADMMPDLLLGNVKPLVTQFAGEGMMAELGDVCRGRAIYDNVLAACTGDDGAVYMAPLFLNAYCMAINPDLFEDADCLKFADTENHSWNSSDFFDAEIDMFDYGNTDFASLYCGGQNGDFATRAFVNNLYGGGLVAEDGSGYAFVNDENLRALKKLVRYKGFRWDDTLLSEDAAYLFSCGEYAASLYWSADLAREYTTDFPVIPMAYPTEDGSIGAQPGEVWGLSVFDCGDPARLEAARQLVSGIYENAEAYTALVRLSGYFAARDGFTLYAEDALLAPYEALSRYISPEKQSTPNWIHMRTAWCEMLRTIGTTEDIGESGIREAMEVFEAAANDF